MSVHKGPNTYSASGNIVSLENLFPIQVTAPPSSVFSPYTAASFPIGRQAIDSANNIVWQLTSIGFSGLIPVPVWSQLNNPLTGPVISVEGTQSQIFVNGTYGTPTNGQITLSGPQDLDDLSNPTFNSLLLNGTLSLESTITGTVSLFSFSLNKTLVLDDDLGPPLSFFNNMQNIFGVNTTNGDIDFCRAHVISTYVIGNGTISNYRGLSITPLEQTSGTTEIVESVGLSVEIPGIGTNQYTAYFDNVVCIGGLSTTYALFVSTDSAGKPGVGGLWSISSDQRLKKDITYCQDALEKLCALKVREFKFTDEYCKESNIKIGSVHHGFLAHEYEEVFPDDVVTSDMTIGETCIEDCKHINTGQTSALVIRAIQQLHEEIQKIKTFLEI